MRYFVKLSYSGAGFHGWQVQPGEESIQEALEKALSTLLRTATTVTGAGRTDTGVNAVGYIAHFDADNLPDAKVLTYKLNAILPKQIAVLEIGPADTAFHARFDARRREYTYFLHRVKDPFIDRFSYMCCYPALDFDMMNKAASMLCGRHDFRCFEKTGAGSKTSLCTVFSACWEPYAPTLCAWEPFPEGEEPRYWRFRISADRFLRNMVRATVGTLIEVGRGKRSTDEFSTLILPEDYRPSQASERASRCAAGESVPGNALFLSDIKY